MVAKGSPMRIFPVALAGLILAPAISSSHAAEQDTGHAVELIRLFFAEHSRRFGRSEEPLLNDAAAARRFLVDGLAHDGLQGALQFDPVYDAQDADIANLSIRPDPNTPILRGAAQVRVDFTNFGAKRSFLYTLVRAADGTWQIGDIVSETNNWSLSDLLQDNGFDIRSDPATEVTLFDPVASQEASAALARQPTDAGSGTEVVPGMEEGDLPGDGLAEGGSDLLFLLDGSGSMWGQIDGVAKITTAKRALSGLIGDLAPDTNVGLMAYGHRREGDCTDTEILYPVSSYDTALLAPVIDAITPRGKTPIASALRMAADAIPQSDRPANVLLISDGLETCGGDPCAAAGELAERGIDTRVHVVGFDLTEQENAALQCIAENGGGNYYAANDADGLVDAINRAVADANEPAAPAEPESAPEPAPEPSRQTIFEESFDGPDLEAAWQVVNATDRLAAFTGDGALFISALGGKTTYDNPDAMNRYLLDRELPDGDFDMTLDFNLFRQSGREMVWLALHEDAGNQIGAMAWTWTQGCGTYLNLSLIRLSGKSGAKPEKAQFEDKLFSGPLLDNICSKEPRRHADAVLAALETEGATLRLKRRGREVTAAIELQLPELGDRPAGPFVHETEPMTVLRLSGSPSLLAGQWNKAGSRESHFALRNFSIEAVAE